MIIKELHKEDIKKALTLVWSVFEEFEVPDYSEQGVKCFQEFINYESIIEKFTRGEIVLWGNFMNNDLVGVIAIRDKNHICMLFVSKDFHRQGIARNLFETILAACCKDDDIDSITVNSSPYAVEIYQRLGFVSTDVEQTLNGIRFTPMRYDIIIKQSQIQYLG